MEIPIDITTLFGFAVFAGSLLSGIVGYINRPDSEEFELPKFSKTVIVAIIGGASAFMAAIDTINQQSPWFPLVCIGLLVGWGADSARNGIGLK